MESRYLCRLLVCGASQAIVAAAKRYFGPHLLGRPLQTGCAPSVRHGHHLGFGRGRGGDLYCSERTWILGALGWRRFVCLNMKNKSIK